MEAATLPGRSAPFACRSWKRNGGRQPDASAEQLAAEARAKRLKLLLKKDRRPGTRARIHASAKLTGGAAAVHRLLSKLGTIGLRFVAGGVADARLGGADLAEPAGTDLKLKDAYGKKVDQLIRSRPKVAVFRSSRTPHWVTGMVWGWRSSSPILRAEPAWSGMFRRISRAQTAGYRGGLRGDAGCSLPDLGLFLKELRTTFAPHGWTAVSQRHSQTTNGPSPSSLQMSITRC